MTTKDEIGDKVPINQPPYGIILHMFGLLEPRRNDRNLLRDSEVEFALERLC